MFFLNRSIFLKNSLKINKRHRRRPRKRRRGKHLYSYFLTRKRKYSLYYQPFDSVLIKKDTKISLKAPFNTSKKIKHKVGLKSIKLRLIRIMSLKSLKFCSQKFLRSAYYDKTFKYSVSIVPDYWMTSKPKSVRMGKGKGEFKFKVFFLKKGVEIYNIKYLLHSIKFYREQKLYIFKLRIYFWFLMKILNSKPSVKNVIYKKIL